jgi:hypothetical protein
MLIRYIESAKMRQSTQRTAITILMRRVIMEIMVCFPLRVLCAISVCSVLSPFKALLVTLFAFAALFSIPVQVAKAHGEDSRMQVDREPAGDYLLSVMTAPATLYVGAAHFAVTVTDRQNNQPLLGKKVLVEVTPLETGGDTLSSWATPSMTLLFAYETHLVLPEAGRYLVTVKVVDAAHAVHPVSFEVVARSIVVFQWLILGFFAQAFVVAGWLYHEGLIVWRRQRNDAPVQSLLRVPGAWWNS